MAIAEATKKADLRDQIGLLEAQGELLRIRKQVDVRHVSGLIAQAESALLFENLRGYDMPLVGGLVRTRKRLALGLGATERNAAQRFQQALEHPIPPVTVPTGPV